MFKSHEPVPHPVSSHATGTTATADGEKKGGAEAEADEEDAVISMEEAEAATDEEDAVISMEEDEAGMAAADDEEEADETSGSSCDEFSVGSGNNNWCSLSTSRNMSRCLGFQRLVDGVHMPWMRRYSDLKRSISPSEKSFLRERAREKTQIICRGSESSLLCLFVLHPLSLSLSDFMMGERRIRK